MAHELYVRWAPKLRDALKSIGSLIVVVGLLVVGFFGGHLLAPGHSGDVAHEEGESATTATELPSLVTLTAQKEANAEVHATPLETRQVQAAKTVAATVEYDVTRHLALRAPVDCVVDTLAVSTGQSVEQGAPLATLSSSEVALARTEVRKAEADVHIAQIQYDWTTETHDNLQQLLDMLKLEPPVSEIEAQFDEASLGSYRDNLLTSYSQFKLARNVADRIKPLDEKGFISGRTAEERASQRDIASTAFKTACDQAEFESRRELARAEAELDVARQQLAVSNERLRLVLGPFADGAKGDTPSTFELRAPFKGRIESLPVAPSTRVAKGEPLLQLADTSQLRVSARVHQHDWDALQLDVGQAIYVSVPALPGEQFEARVSYVGAEVSPETRAIPLVAELDNRQGRFRPGMFAWVSLPMEAPRRALAVPPSAIQRHESKAFVFVQEGERRFRRANVEVGLETPDYVEIVSGLTEGQRVVDHGAFYLKSELLLEQEEE